MEDTLKSIALVFVLIFMLVFTAREQTDLKTAESQAQPSGALISDEMSSVGELNENPILTDEPNNGSETDISDEPIVAPPL